MQLSIKRLNPKAQIPTRATSGSAGMDLHALLDQPLLVPAGGRVIIPTGIAIEIPKDDLVGLIYARSGLAVKHGLTLSNCVGVIDSDYTGEIRVGLVNLSDTEYTIQPGERIAQLVIAPIVIAEPVEVEEINDTSRGAGGFGSTGRI
ncbi:MAG: dUTP diphosphatase [Oscillospiraceae bacterium]|nr:dUTP diphosphatase [Oscillospiraceae bacterium]MDD4413917.1 dUTP diphosphatase [Oscillospiraceae bacterium]